MKIDHRTTLWRGRNGRLWRLADRLEHTASSLRYAEKPHDLVFAITTLTELTNQLRDLMWQWLAERIGLDKRDFGRWPKL